LDVKKLTKAQSNALKVAKITLFKRSHNEGTTFRKLHSEGIMSPRIMRRWFASF